MTETKRQGGVDAAWVDAARLGEDRVIARGAATPGSTAWSVRVLYPADSTRITCDLREQCGRQATHCMTWQSPIMPGPAFSYLCDEHIVAQQRLYEASDHAAATAYNRARKVTKVEAVDAASALIDQGVVARPEEGAPGTACPFCGARYTTREEVRYQVTCPYCLGNATRAGHLFEWVHARIGLLIKRHNAAELEKLQKVCADGLTGYALACALREITHG